MATQIPPWLNIDPIEPARIRLRANAQRQAADNAAQARQMQWERLEAQREHDNALIAAQQQSQGQRLALQRDLQGQRLAQAGAAAEMRSQMFDRQLRLREAKAEQEAAVAARQMQGMRNIEEGVKNNIPIAELMTQNAPLIFARNPAQMGSAIRAVTPPGEPTFGKTPGGMEYAQNPRTGALHFPPQATPEFGGVAKELRDEQGRPLGINYIPGSRGSVKPLADKSAMSLGERLRLIQTKLYYNSKELGNVSPKSPEGQALKQKQTDLLKQLDELEKPLKKVAGKLDEAEVSPEDEGETPIEDLLPPVGSDEEEAAAVPEEEED